MILQFQYALTCEEETDLYGRMLGTNQEVFKQSIRKIWIFVFNTQIQTKQPLREIYSLDMEKVASEASLQIPVISDQKPISKLATGIH